MWSFLVSVAFLQLILASTIANIDSLQVQVEQRKKHKPSILDDVFQLLSEADSDYIELNLRKLNAFNGTECQACHNKIKVAQQLLKENAADDYKISLLLYKYCLEQNKGKDSKCEFIDFFLSTTTGSGQVSNSALGPQVGFEGATSINFFYNDFINFVKYVNTSSSLSLDYYCHYKGKYCPLPKTPELSTIIDLESWWPKKEPMHFQEPQYNSSRERFNVLHLSDFHNELRYQVGAEANCTQGLCCLPESYNKKLTKPKYNFTDIYTDAGAVESDIELSFYPSAHFDSSNDTYSKGKLHDLPAFRGWNWVWEPATTFGNYECDPPEVMLNHSLKYVSSTFGDNKYEFSLFTGDIVDHDTIHCDANVTKYAEIRSYRIMKHFLNQLPIFPTLGNHDTFPYGQLAPDRIQGKALNESVYHWNDQLMSDLWISNGWLQESERQQIKQHYSAFSTVTKRGLKVISLNSNCYYQKNLYSYIDVENEPDLFGQWKFLIDELIQSERDGQRVWILAHIPAGDTDTIPIQSQIFARIVERFSPYTIANIFYGHTHRDQFKVLYLNDLTPVNMAWISQAITPLGPANPSWRYYQVEDQSFNIINAYNYYTPLNETWVSGGKEPAWQYEYSPRDTYDPQKEWPENAPLNATFWDKFVVKMLGNRLDTEFNQRYTDLMFRENPYVMSCKNGTEVSSKCYENNYCDIIGFKVDDYNECVKSGSS